VAITRSCKAGSAEILRRRLLIKAFGESRQSGNRAERQVFHRKKSHVQRFFSGRLAQKPKQIERRDQMPDEAAAIIEIMRAVGVYDFVMSRVKDADKAVQMFRNDFSNLMRLCAGGI
jgi:hypothetical protein